MNKQFLDSLQDRIDHCTKTAKACETKLLAKPNSKALAKDCYFQQGFVYALNVMVSDLEYYGIITEEEKQTLLNSAHTIA